MKTINIFTIAAISALFIACGPEGKKAETTEAQAIETTATGVDFTVDSAAIVNWTGSKMAGDHMGTLNISEGVLTVTNNNLTGGNITIDMNSINNTDLEGEWKMKLEGHLKSADFFHVDSFPTAQFVISDIAVLEGNPEANSTITGNLTLKDVTKSISFEALVKVTDAEVKIMAPNFIIDRTEFNVQYGSSKIFDIVKDKAIYDEMAINFNISAKK